MNTPRTVSGWRKLVGSYVRYTRRHSALYCYGTIERVAGKNVWISGNPEWAPDIIEIELWPPTESAALRERAGREGGGES